MMAQMALDARVGECCCAAGRLRDAQGVPRCAGLITAKLHAPYPTALSRSAFLLGVY